MMVDPYSPVGVRAAVKKLDALLAAPDEARHVPKILNECGIRFVVVESLKAASIDGVCFWLDEQSPVVGMTLRHDRIDNFWFVLRHEIEHVIRVHGLKQVAFDTELEGEKAGFGEGVPEQERTANRAAASFCVPQDKLDMYISRKEPFFSERDVVALSRMMDIHPRSCRWPAPASDRPLQPAQETPCEDPQRDPAERLYGWLGRCCPGLTHSWRD